MLFEVLCQMSLLNFNLVLLKDRENVSYFIFKLFVDWSHLIVTELQSVYEDNFFLAEDQLFFYFFHRLSIMPLFHSGRGPDLADSGQPGPEEPGCVTLPFKECSIGQVHERTQHSKVPVKTVITHRFRHYRCGCWSRFPAHSLSSVAC